MKHVKKVLIIYATSGSGHLRAAEALGQAFSQNYPDVEYEFIDFARYSTRLMRNFLIDSYFRITKSTPELWGYLYKKSDKRLTWQEEKFRHTFINLNAGKFIKLMKQRTPDAVICTHMLPLEILGNWRIREKISCPVYAVVTDYGLHSLWVCRGVDCYFVASEEIKRHLARRGQPEHQIHVTGIPVEPKFETRRNAPDVRQKLGLKEISPTVMVVSGGWSVTPIEGAVKAFKDYADRCQLLVLAGKDKSMQERLGVIMSQYRIPGNIYGFADNIDELMDASDIVVTKTGGLITSECLAKGRPIAVISPIPGQEERNAEYILENGAGTMIQDMQDCAGKIFQIFGNKKRWEAMQLSAQHLGLSHAALSIARKVIELSQAQ